MAVVLILDRFDIDREDALIVEANEAAINAARKQINQHLEAANKHLLRICLKSPALFRRFSDYEGLNGVLPTQRLLPRTLLGNTLKTEIPEWLSDELIVSLGLLENFQASEDLDISEVDNGIEFEKILLKSCDANLFSYDINGFILALAKQRQQFLQLLNIESVQNCFKTHLILGLSLSDDVAVLLIQELLKTGSIHDFLNNLAYQQHLQCLRQLPVTLALPAKTLPDGLLEAFPTLFLTEADANGLPEKFIAALHAIERKIFNQKLTPETLAQVLVDWPSLLTELSELVASHNALMTEELLEKLAYFSSEQSQSILKQLEQRTRSYPLLDANASIEETLVWSEDYFDYCRSLFLDKQNPDEAANISFTHWLLAQAARVSRSNNSWQYASQQIEAYLKEAYIVVVIMVDALSALNQDIILAELAGLNHLNLQRNVLFAPLPTLTEVGKMAVLTGLETEHQQGTTQADILQNHYQNYLPVKDSLKVIKSWAESSERLHENNQLVVLFENRLDERLHDCVSFNKHREDIKPIIKQIKRSIESWRKDAAQLNKEIAFFITADHGMTVTSEYYPGQPLGKVKERVFKEVKSSINHPDFELIKNYAIPKKRVRLNNDALLTHGGLTPEEVIIPFISLTSNIPQPIKTPLEISLKSQQCINLPNKVWQIECLLNSNMDVSNIQLSVASPFKGKDTLDSLRAGKSQSLKFNFSSEHLQQGLTEIQMHLSYVRNDGYREENEKLFNIEFPSSLIEKDSATQNFEDMF